MNQASVTRRQIGGFLLTIALAEGVYRILLNTAIFAGLEAFENYIHIGIVAYVCGPFIVGRLANIPAFECCVLSAWILALPTGLLALAFYINTPGPSGGIPARWPNNDVLHRTPERSCFVLFIHPHCPCTRASIRQLERALALAPQSVDVWGIVYEPLGVPTTWTTTGLVDLVRSLPGARITIDRDGVLTKRFGVRTSGHLLAYDRHGELVFEGGLVPARGHEGLSEGFEAICKMVRGERPGVRRTPSYGCTIVNESPADGMENAIWKLR